MGRSRWGCTQTNLAFIVGVQGLRLNSEQIRAMFGHNACKSFVVTI